MSRRERAVILGGLLALFAWAPAAYAQRNLNQSDRLLLYYYNFYKSQRDARMLQQNQVTLQQDLNRFQQSTLAQQRATESRIDPLDRYVRELRTGSSADRRSARRLPDIYNGGGGRKQYFMRIQYFNPPQRNRGF